MRSRALLLALLAAPVAASGGVLLERVLAVVNGRPVLFSGVLLLERVKGLDEKTATDAAIDERLMGEEAAQLPQAAVTKDEEDRLYEELVSRMKGVPKDVTEADLRAFVGRELAILKYVDFRFRTEARVSDAEVQKAYDEEYSGLPNPPDRAEAGESLRQRLENVQVSRAVEAWVKELRASAEILYVPGP
jgi:hypothetical protein